MKQFKDMKGRPWDVEVTVSTLKRVKALLGVDLMQVVEGKDLLQRLYADPCFLVDVVCAVLRPQLEAKGVGDEDFGAAMAGDAIEHAAVALIEEIIAFCPSQKDRANLLAVWKAAQSGMERARDLAAARIQSGALDKAIDKAIGQTLGTAGISSTTPPASSASTPAPTP